jgi:hypothetical protein
MQLTSLQSSAAKATCSALGPGKHVPVGPAVFTLRHFGAEASLCVNICPVTGVAPAATVAQPRRQRVTNHPEQPPHLSM